MSVSDTLRQAIRQSDQTLYRIAKDAGVDWSVLQRFLDGSRPNIRLDTVEKLCLHFGLELRPANAGRGRRSGSRPPRKMR
jgi:hypothetical protein